MGNIMSSEQKSPFQKIYEENYMKMYHIAFGILKHRMEAENAVQEAFVSIAKNYTRYKEVSESGMSAICIISVKK